MSSHENEIPENINTRLFLRFSYINRSNIHFPVIVVSPLKQSPAASTKVSNRTTNAFSTLKLNSKSTTWKPSFRTPVFHFHFTISSYFEIFIFILSGGILESEWCIKELRSAIKANKKLLIIRDNSYRLPELFPVKLMDIEPTIRNSKTITWMAEYNSNCIEKIKGNALGTIGIHRTAEVLGPSDMYIASMEKFFQENSIKNGHLDLSHWDKSITGFLNGFS
jgi:hypothetical protein